MVEFQAVDVKGFVNDDRQLMQYIESKIGGLVGDFRFIHPADISDSVKRRFDVACLKLNMSYERRHARVRLLPSVRAAAVEQIEPTASEETPKEVKRKK